MKTYIRRQQKPQSRIKHTEITVEVCGIVVEWGRQNRDTEVCFSMDVYLFRILL